MRKERLTVTDTRLSRWSIAEISNHTGIPTRQLRYVVDHNLGPIKEIDPEEISPGNPRVYDVGSATLIVAAAKLLAAGVRRDTVKTLLIGFKDIPTRSKTTVEIGDGTHIRYASDESDSGWRSLEGDRMSKHRRFNPFATISVDLGKIRKLFK